MITAWWVGAIVTLREGAVTFAVPVSALLRRSA
jgi:hypothetical protein